MSASTYSFTTDVNDNYFPRVIDEATDDTNFLIITERDTVLGKTPNALLFIRKAILVLGLVQPELTLAGRTLGEWLVGTFTNDPTPESEWTFAVLESDDAEAVEEELVSIRNEIKRIDNIINGRTIRTTVESF